MDQYKDLLTQYSGYTDFRPGQFETLNYLNAGKHTLAILPTGGGKSLIYQLFQFQQTGHTLIISPLISLMQDQVEQLQRNGIKSVVALNSSLDHKTQKYVLAHLKDYQFLFMSPEMIQRPDILQQIKQMELHLLVIDEAHCISQWGYDFRPEYSELKFVREQLGWPLTLALTATATERTITDIYQYLFSRHEHVEKIKVSIDRPNIFYAFEAVASPDKYDYLKDLLETLPKPGIVYVHQKKELEELVGLLRGMTAIRLESYHADRDVDERHIIQQQFLHGELDVIFATSAFGMGINQGNVRFVIHYHLPQSLEELTQEIGRAGRDGQPAIAFVLYNQSEINRLQFMANAYQDEAAALVDNLRFYLTQEKQQKQQFLAQLDETQQAFIRFYTGHFSDWEAIIQHQEQYLYLKKQQLHAIINLVLHKACYRQNLLNVFDETLTGDSAFCCSNCQPHYQSESQWKKLLAQEAGLNSAKIPAVDWRLRLKYLLT